LLAYASISVSIGDVPAFDVADRTSWVAAVSVRAEAYFEKTDQRFVVCFRHEYDER
jgi:hypothetical protein